MRRALASLAFYLEKHERVLGLPLPLPPDHVRARPAFPLGPAAQFAEAAVLTARVQVGELSVARSRLSIIIAVSDPVVLKGLLAILRAESDFNVVASCGDGAACARAMYKLSPDLALVEMSLPGRNGFQLLAAIKRDRLSTRVVFLSASPAPSAAAIARGAYGTIAIQAAPQLLLRGLRQVAVGLKILPVLGMSHPAGDDAQGGLPDLFNILTEREREIARLVCIGLSNKEVGRQLSLAEGTVKVHLHHIYRKLAIQNRTSLAALAAGSLDPTIGPTGPASGRPDDGLLPRARNPES